MHENACQSRFLFEAAAWGHLILRRDNPHAQVVVPNHRELDKGTLRSIIRQAQLEVDEFIELLEMV